MVSNLSSSETTTPVLRVRNLSKCYGRGGLWRNWVSVSAASGVDFDIFAGKTLALIGQSGSGTSTIARCVSRLEKPDEGEIRINGTDVAALQSRELLDVRTKIQMVFQDATSAMNPRFSAAQAIEEPLLIRGMKYEERRWRLQGLMTEVGLRPHWADRSILEFSGGQRQRVAIARALVLRPSILILDEAFTGLDLSTQSQIANLLLDLQKTHSLTYLLISHDLTLVARFADSMAVMHEGRIVESGPTPEIMAAPKHPETSKLVAAAKAAEKKLAPVAGEIM